MTVRRRILLFQLVTIVFVGVVVGLMLTTLKLTDDFVNRIDGVHSRFEAISDLDGLGNNYAEQLAEVLLLGREQMPDFQLARQKMAEGFRVLAEVTRKEFATLGSLGDVQQELPEIEFAARLQEFYRAIDRAAERVFQAQAAGQQDRAVDIFRRSIEYRLSNDFEAMLGDARQEERGEVAEELARVRSTQHTVLIVAGVFSVLAVVAGLGLGLTLHHSIVRPVRLLVAGAEAIASGQLDHRIETSRRDEFLVLSQSFNKMAESIERQRASLTSARARLEREVDQRTRELRQANDQLLELDGKRSQFLADASHELRTPLTILRGEAEVALRGKPGLASFRDALNRIQLYAADMARLLEDLIDFTRLEIDDVTYDFETVEAEDVVVAAVRDSEILGQQKQMEVQLLSREPKQLIRADPRRLKQALMIGIDNAIKYADPGGSIDIDICRSDDILALTIRDHGCGIDAAELPFVFDRYYRGRNNASRAANGLGIGLPIARTIIERHDGTITLGPAPQRGAVLTIRLPIAERKAACES
ncbi:sensor histidine kinase [Rhizobium leguminosarum]|uniref:sensor histidine kinase n=1 Tax=Rhizobium leguminosarum TaxID=384 RepID=UPI001C9600AF|nr:HAMP domain-containing sensor histidine kinase [Rhizobium leguminosarum]MBY5544075.1 HAMP domain-containing histidine kinase [Rhizobium leguminosarum]MBY5664088.1 HAMP domain-containing histidine kinase [Rhizobium leguminosarum]MBY5678027.1 HAMP domain-containing histidine kinase [Rhizobium leguminosarum]